MGLLSRVSTMCVQIPGLGLRFCMFKVDIKSTIIIIKSECYNNSSSKSEGASRKEVNNFMQGCFLKEDDLSVKLSRQRRKRKTSQVEGKSIHKKAWCVKE